MEKGRPARFTALLVCLLALLSIHPGVTFAAPLAVYLSPDGRDSRDGRKPATAVLTLSRALAIISAALPGRDRDVEVRIAPGVYRGQRVVWDFTMPDRRIRFMPLRDDKVRPVFDGAGEGGTWFALRQRNGEPSNLSFEYIEVRNYATAISLNGDREQIENSNGHNYINGNYFAQIGEGSTAAVRLVNSDRNHIVNNYFVDIIRSERCVLLHAIYLAHHSQHNEIARNRFKRSCGDPIRLRDYSNHNQIRTLACPAGPSDAGGTDSPTASPFGGRLIRPRNASPRV